MTTVVELTGDESRLLRSLNKVADAERKVAREMDKAGQAGEQAGRRIGNSMTQAGTQSTREINKLLRELRRTGPEGRKQAKALENHFRETGKHGRRSMESVVRSIAKIDDEALKVAANTRDEFRKVERAGKKAYGDDAVKRLASWASGWASASLVIGNVKELIAQVNAEQAKALDTLQGGQDPNRRLLQVSESQQDYENLRATADRLSTEYGMDRNEAKQLVFSARSEGFEGALDFIGRGSPIVSPQAQATVAGQIPGLFQGEGLRAEQAVNMTLAGAAASRLSFEDIARALPGAAEGGALAGATSEETVGALSVLAGRFKSGETAADRLKAFASRVGLDEGNVEMGRESLAGTGIVEAVERLQAMPEAQRRDFLGESQEVNAAFVILTEELDKVRGRIEQISEARQATGTATSPMAVRRAAFESDSAAVAALRARAAENANAIANVRANAEDEADRVTRQAGVEAAARNRGESEFGIQLGRQVGNLARGVGSAGEMVGANSAAETNVMANTAHAAFAGGALSSLQRSAAAAMEQAGSAADRARLQAVLLGAGSLARRDQEAPGGQALLSRGEAAQVLRMAPGGDNIPLDAITPQIQQQVTQQIRAAAAANTGRTDTDFTGLASFFGGGATADSRAILSATQLDELIAELRRQNDIQQQRAGAAPPPNYSGGLQSGSAAAQRSSF